MIRLLFTICFFSVCLSLFAATTYEVPTIALEDPVYHGASIIEFDPVDGSRTAYHWDGRKYVKMWRRG